MKQLFFLLIAFMFCSCATEIIILNESRSDQLSRHGYSTSGMSTLIAQNISDSTVTLTVDHETFLISAGAKIELNISSGFYKVDSQKYVFTNVDRRKGYDIEFLPAFVYKTKLN